VQNSPDSVPPGTTERLAPAARAIALPPAARIAISAVFLACGIYMGLWATQIARIKLVFGLTDPGLATVVLAFACGSIPMMPLAGSLMVRWGGVRSIRATCIASAVGLVLLGMAPSYPALLGASFLAGGAVGALDVVMNGQANEIAAVWRRPILSSIHGWFSLGGLLGSAAGGALTGAGLPVPMVLGAGGANILLAGLAATPFLNVPGTTPTHAGPAFALPTRAVLGLGVMCLLSLMIEGGIGDWTTVYLHEVAGASLDWAAAGIAGFSTAMAFGRFTGDWVVRQLGSRPVMIGSGLLTAAGIGLAVALPAPGPASAGFLLAGLGMANIVPLLFAASARVPGVPPSAGLAMVATMGYGAFLMGPPLIGFLAGAVSLRIALLVLVACALVIAVGGLWRRA
jgi:MFS family permease